MNLLAVLRILFAIIRLLNIRIEELAEVYSDAEGCQYTLEQFLELAGEPKILQ